MIRMNEDIRKQWVEALRSGKYPQGRDYLVTVENEVENFCCLGVLCDLASDAGVIEKLPAYFRTLGKVVPYGNQEQVFGLPEVVMEWAGISEQGEEIHRLISMNDTGVSFDKIANVIAGADND